MLHCPAVRSHDIHSDQKRIQADKLRAVGQLAAGIAHEMNTPIQFIGDNIAACAELFPELQRLIAEYGQLLQYLEANNLCPDAVTRIRRCEADIDLEYLLDDLPRAFTESLEGVDRVRVIVQAMKEFSHVDRLGQRRFFDVNAALSSTLIVARNELRYVAEVQTAYADVPPAWGAPGEINQVFLNLLVNAAHAIHERATEDRGQILVSTSCRDGWVITSIRDNGCGIPEEVQNRICEPFFTTKEVGIGTGQGLAIAHHIVVERHGGRLDFETTPGVGTVFHVVLPSRSEGESAAVP